MNSRDRKINGLAIHRRAGLGHPRFWKREIKHNDKKVVHHENLLQTTSDKDEIGGDVDVSNGSFSFSFSFVFPQSNSFYRSNHILCSHNTNNRDNLCGGQSSEYAFCWTIASPPFIDFCEPVLANPQTIFERRWNKF